ncbi:Sodium/hydrogen exchanger 9B2 [Chamberlinius hualienensis]
MADKKNLKEEKIGSGDSEEKGSSGGSAINLEEDCKHCPTQEFLLKDMTADQMETSEDAKLPITETKVYEACTSEESHETSDGCLTKLNRFLDKIRFPKYILLIITGVFFWGNLWLLTGSSALPGGSLFALFFLSVFSWIGGELISVLHLPPLLGMLAVGFALRNLPTVNIAEDLNPQMSSSLRNIALAVILCRAGLSLDPQKLRKLRLTFVGLSLVPCLLEACATAVAATFILNFPWLWSFILGFVVAGVSPAVVVPSMIVCQDKRLGTNKGIPTLLIASGSLDNVTAIAAFGIVLSITFSTKPLYMTIIQGPLEVVIGIVFGALVGTITWFYTIRIKRGRLLLQCLLLLLGCMFAIFGSRYVGYPGAGPLGSLVLPFSAAYGWRKRGKLDKRIPLVFNTIWLIFQPILFGLIGSEVKLSNLVGNTVGYGVAIVLIAVVARSIVTFFVTAKSNFNLRERLFITLSWIPKATVQATVGPVALDTARQLTAGTENVTFGIEVLTIAVISILLTAPTGAIAMSLTAPRLLTREVESAQPV